MLAMSRTAVIDISKMLHRLSTSASGKLHYSKDDRYGRQLWAEAVWKREYLLIFLGNQEMLDEAFH